MFWCDLTCSIHEAPWRVSENGSESAVSKLRFETVLDGLDVPLTDVHCMDLLQRTSALNRLIPEDDPADGGRPTPFSAIVSELGYVIHMPQGTVENSDFPQYVVSSPASRHLVMTKGPDMMRNQSGRTNRIWRTKNSPHADELDTAFGLYVVAHNARFDLRDSSDATKLCKFQVPMY